MPKANYVGLKTAHTSMSIPHEIHRRKIYMICGALAIINVLRILIANFERVIPLAITPSMIPYAFPFSILDDHISLFWFQCNLVNFQPLVSQHLKFDWLINCRNKNLWGCNNVIYFCHLIDAFSIPFSLILQFIINSNAASSISDVWLFTGSTGGRFGYMFHFKVLVF